MELEKIYSKRRQIRAAWDQKKLPSKEIIYDLLKRTLNIAPSKQNLFPFEIYAYGPNDLEKKKIVGQICSLYKTGSVNHMDEGEKSDGVVKTAAGDIDVRDQPALVERDHRPGDHRQYEGQHRGNEEHCLVGPRGHDDFLDDIFDEIRETL